MSRVEAQICAISGGSGAGKTTLATKLLERLGDRGTHLTIDWYYRDLSHLSADERADFNFDHPDSLEVDLFVDDLCTIRAGSAVAAPVYDFSTHTRGGERRPIEPRQFVVTEGIHLLGLEAVRSHCDLLVYIDVPADTRLARRLRRDVMERGRSSESVLHQWRTTVDPMHRRFVQPGMAFADVVVTPDDDIEHVAARLAAELHSRAHDRGRQRLAHD